MTGKWSYSRVSTFQGCPLKYYYSYENIFDSSEKVNTTLADKGSALHTTIEKYHTGMSRDELLVILEEKCKSYGIINDDVNQYTEEEFKAKYPTEELRSKVYNETAGIDRTLLFWDYFVRPREEGAGYTVSQELKITREIRGQPFTGALDLLLEPPEQFVSETYPVIVVDWKTGKSINPKSYKKQQILYAYMYGLEKGWTIEETAKKVKLFIFGPLSDQGKKTPYDAMLNSLKPIEYSEKDMQDIIDEYFLTIDKINLVDWSSVDFNLLGVKSFACEWCQFKGSVEDEKTGFKGCPCTYNLGFRQPRGVTFNPRETKKAEN